MTMRDGTFTGTVYLPGDAAYDENRKALRADLDLHPPLVVRACGVDDVRTR
jgi:hypothetical protein